MCDATNSNPSNSFNWAIFNLSRPKKNQKSNLKTPIVTNKFYQHIVEYKNVFSNLTFSGLNLKQIICNYHEFQRKIQKLHKAHEFSLTSHKTWQRLHPHFFNNELSQELQTKLFPNTPEGIIHQLKPPHGFTDENEKANTTHA